MKKFVGLICTALLFSACTNAPEGAQNFTDCVKEGGIISGEDQGNLICTINEKSFVATDAEKTAYFTIDDVDSKIKPVEKTQIANPASQNCIDKGGSLEIKKDSEGNEYGVCLFEDNRQCEEWALMHGDCPMGGVKITGYDNNGQIFCAIRGGSVNMETKMCILPDGKECGINEDGITCPDMDSKKDADDSSSTGLTIEEMAKIECEKENVSEVYVCGDYYRVVSSLDGAGSIIQTASGESFTCPVVAPDSMSEDCKKYMLGSNCAEINICEKMVGNDKDEHGCIGSAGYIWSEEKQTCVRPWEDDEINKIFLDLSKDSQIDFSIPYEEIFEWFVDGDKKDISGKAVEAAQVSREVNYFSEWFISNGFKEDLNQAADGVGESRNGYIKDKIACVVNIKLMDNVYAIKEIKIDCGELK